MLVFLLPDGLPVFGLDLSPDLSPVDLLAVLSAVLSVVVTTRTLVAARVVLQKLLTLVDVHLITSP